MQLFLDRSEMTHCDFSTIDLAGYFLDLNSEKWVVGKEVSVHLLAPVRPVRECPG